MAIETQPSPKTTQPGKPTQAKPSVAPRVSTSQKMHLDSWQKEVLEYDGDLLLCTGRRVGKTYILARKAVELMAKRKKCPIVMLSLTEDQAMIIIAMALNYAREAFPRLIGKGKEKPTLKTLTINGNKMIVRPVGSTGDGARGFEGGVLIVDEASRMPSMFWMAAKPLILTTNGQIWMGSTPFGKGTKERPNYFWERFNESYNLKKEGARFKVFYISTEQAIEQREISESWTKEQREGALRVLKEDKQEMTALEYGQEYMGLFMDDLVRVFSDELIEKVCVLSRRAEIKKGCYYGGVDVGRMGENKSSMEIGERINKDTAEQVENITTKKTLTTDTAKKIIELQELYKCKMWGIDGAGVGGGVLDMLLENPKTRNNVEDLNNAKKVTSADGERGKKLLKEEMYINLLRVMESGKIKLLSDFDIKLSLGSALYGYDDNGNLRIFGNENDIREGIIRMAWEIAKDKSLNLWASCSRDGRTGKIIFR